MREGVVEQRRRLRGEREREVVVQDGVIPITSPGYALQ